VSTSGKVLFVAEIIVCFGPAVALFLVGATMFPLQLYFLVTSPNVESLLFISWVTSGALGTVALIDISRGIFDPSAFRANPGTTLMFALAGIGALLPFPIAFSEKSALMSVAIVPLAAALHILYLGRGFLFGWWRQ
jgi:hypothetical protein